MNMEEYLIKIYTDGGSKHESYFTTKSLLKAMHDLDKNHTKYAVYECECIVDKS